MWRQFNSWHYRLYSMCVGMYFYQKVMRSMSNGTVRRCCCIVWQLSVGCMDVKLTLQNIDLRSPWAIMHPLHIINSHESQLWWPSSPQQSPS